MDLRRYDALALTAGLWFLAKFLRYAFPPLFPTFRETFAVSSTLLGTAFTAMMLVYAAMQFPSGVLADRVGPVAVIAAGGLVAAVAAGLLALPVGFLALVAGMALVGLGTGAHKTVAVRLLSAIYPARTGRALGVLDTVGALSGVAAPAAVVAAAEATDWRAAFLAGGVAGVALVALFLWRVPARLRGAAERAGADPPGGGPAGEPETDGGSPGGAPPGGPGDDGTGDAAGDDPAGLADYVRPFRDRRLLAFVVATVLFSFGYNGVVAFLPLFLTDGGLAAAEANLLYSVLFGLAIVQAATGDLSDRVGQLPVLAALLALSTVSLAAVVALPGDGVVALGVAVVGLGVGSHGYRPVRGAYLMAALPETFAGGGLGFVRTVLMAAGAVAPAVVGGVADTTGFDAAFGLLAAAMAGATLLVAGLVLTGR